MRKLFSWLWKSLLVMVLLAGLLLGFSFVERGRLAEMAAMQFGLPWDRPVPVRELMPQEPDPWVHVTGMEEVGGVDRPNDHVMIDRDVQGGIRAKSVHVAPGAAVYGSIEVSGTVRFDGRFLQGDLRGEQVMIQEGEGFPDHHPDFRENPDVVRIQGNVDGERITIGPEVTIAGNVGSDKSRVDLAGHVHGQVKGETVRLSRSAVVEGDVLVTGDTLRMEPGAQIRGRIVTPKGDAIRIVQPEGEEIRWDGDWRERGPHPEAGWSGPPAVYHREPHERWMGFGFHWIPTLMGVLALVLVAWLFRREEVDRIRDRVKAAPWRSLWSGLWTAVVSVPVLFLLVISIIGIPAAVLLAVILGLAALAGFAALCVQTGSLLGEKLGFAEKREILEVLLGTLVLASLLWIPLIGWFLLAAGLLAGFGAAVSLWGPRFRQAWTEWRSKKKN